MSEAPVDGVRAQAADDVPPRAVDGAPAQSAPGGPAHRSRDLRPSEPPAPPPGRALAQSPGGPGRHRAAPVTVRVAGGRLQDDLRAVGMVWRRELIRFGRNRLRIITSLVQPVLFLFVLGTGLSSLMGRGLGAGVDFRTFMFPGVVAMTVLFTAIFSSVSIVWDREFGFLREMLVAPVRRGALVVGKCAGGATVATTQALIMLALAGFVHVPYAPSLIFTLLGEMVLAAVMITALGTALASRMAQVESFQVVMQFVVLPLFFLSGALFPLRDLPSWLAVLTKFDPLAYVVDAMRRAVFGHVRTTPGLRTLFAGGVTWNGWTVPVGLELGITAALGAVLLGIAVYTFGKTD